MYNKLFYIYLEKQHMEYLHISDGIWMYAAFLYMQERDYSLEKFLVFLSYLHFLSFFENIPL